MANEIEKRMPMEQRGALEVRQQVNQIQYLMREVLKDGEHFGTIKGCGTKPTLLQSGAEKIAYMFHFVPEYEVTRVNLEGGHREYEVKCTLRQRDTNQVMGGGLGLCTTMESKYRYRWEGYGNNRHRVENQDIADTYNTVLKRAKKRAFVDAVKSTTAASDIFTQDIEDLPVLEYEDVQHNIHAAQPVQASVVQQQQQQQRAPRLNTLRKLMSEAQTLGILVFDKNDPNAGLVGWVHVTYGCEPDELGNDQIAECEEYVRGRIADAQELARQREAAQQATEPVYETDGQYEEYAADLADHDISF